MPGTTESAASGLSDLDKPRSFPGWSKWELNVWGRSSIWESKYYLYSNYKRS